MFLFIITLRRLKVRLLTVFVACLVLLGLCWGVPRCYAFLAAEEEEFEELDDPVRVETDPDAESIGTWLRVFGQ